MDIEALRIAIKVDGYNPPATAAMLLSQFAHQMFLDGRCSYEEHVEVMDWAYEQPSLLFHEDWEA